MLTGALVRIFEFFKQLSKAPRVRRIRIVPDGCVIDYESRDPFTVRWADVRQIFAYKEDVFTVDLICIGFRINDESTWVSADEEMIGYRELILAIEKRFGVRESSWFQKVAVPAFARNFTTIWGEDSQRPVYSKRT